VSVAGRGGTDVAIWALACVLALASGCSGPQTTDASSHAAPTPAGPSGSVPATAQQTPPTPTVELPDDFPVPDGLERVIDPGDPPDLVARWTTARSGASVYDAFVAALPPAGYAIRDLYPGGAAAVIVLGAAGGGAWELSMFGTDPLTVELRIAPD
jgi:hypothetical protein